jgi:hypothetical protein
MNSYCRLSLNENTDIKILQKKLNDCSQCVLEYEDLQSFKYNFNRFSDILNTYSKNVNAIYAVNYGKVFEDTVYILSTLEDFLQVPISDLFINNDPYYPIINLINFYETDLSDGSLNIGISCGKYYKDQTLSGVIETMLLIERLNSTLTGSVNINLDMDNINPIWTSEIEIFDSIYPYVRSFMFKEYIQVIK